MKTIDLDGIIKKRNLDPNEIAKELFPSNRYPRLALNRVLKKKALLNADQISRLSAITGISISELYGRAWKSSYKKDLHILTCGEFRAELDTTTWITRLYHNGSLCHEEILHSGAIMLNEYISLLDKLTLKFKNDEN